MRLMSRAALAFAAVLVAAPALRAQTSFSIAAGAAAPIGSTADDLKMGYNATVGLGIKPPVAPLGLRFEGMLNQMDFKTSALGSTRLISGSANVTLSGPAVPMGYLIGGVGMYNVALPDVANADAVNKVGFNIGGGLTFPLTGFSTYLEARLHVVNTEGQSMKFVPVTFGIKF